MTIPIAIPIESEYAHARFCPCGQQVWHEGALADCADCIKRPEFLCADCRPYVYEDLVMDGEARPVRNLLESLSLIGFGYVVGLAVAGMIYWVTR